jgi:hypothetical protein
VLYLIVKSINEQGIHSDGPVLTGKMSLELAKELEARRLLAQRLKLLNFARPDLIVDNLVIVEAQIRRSHHQRPQKAALDLPPPGPQTARPPINFNVEYLKQGITRIANNLRR